MLLVNPLTGQYLVVNHPGHTDQSVHGRKQVRSLSDSYEALQGLSETPLSFHTTPGTSKQLKRWVRQASEKGGSWIPPTKRKLVGITDRSGTEVLISPRDREIAMHEIGHQKKGHTGEHLDELEGIPEIEKMMEDEAWHWALKNAKKAGVSKRKIRQVIRAQGIQPWEILRYGKGSLFKKEE